MNYTRDVHYSRKLSHQQVNYPDTVQKLSQIMSERSLSSSYSRLDNPGATFSSSGFNTAAFSTSSLNASGSSFFITKNMERKSMKLKEHQDSMVEFMKNERFINERKRLYNRELGRKAVVNQVRIYLCLLSINWLCLDKDHLRHWTSDEDSSLPAQSQSRADPRSLWDIARSQSFQYSSRSAQTEEVERRWRGMVRQLTSLPIAVFFLLLLSLDQNHTCASHYYLSSFFLLVHFWTTFSFSLFVYIHSTVGSFSQWERITSYGGMDGDCR